MKEHPIIFNAEMVRAILDNRKTQMRRVLKPMVPVGEQSCPYGQPGDRLLVVDSHVNLEITDVRVERVQEISEDDAWAEGIELPEIDWERDGHGYCHPPGACVEEFAELWDSINAKRGFGWDDDPWVWVVTFKRIA